MEKKISDMMDQILDDTVDIQILDIASSEKIKEATMTKLYTKTGSNKQVRKTSRVILIAAIVVLALSVSAFAYVGFVVYENPEAMLNAFFGAGEEIQGGGQTEYYADEYKTYKVTWPRWERVPVDETLADSLVEPYISGVGASVAYGNFTLTVEAMLFDSLTGSGMVYYTIENPKGLESYSLQPDGEIWWPEDSEVFTMLNYSGRSYLDKAMSTDTQLYICAYFVQSERWAELFPTLEISIGDGGNRGKIKTISLEFNDGGGMAGFSSNEGGIKISPVGIKIDAVKLGLHLNEVLVDYAQEIILHYSDGSEYVLMNKAENISNIAYALGSDSSATYIFNRIVDVSSLSSVTVNSTAYDVP